MELVRPEQGDAGRRWRPRGRQPVAVATLFAAAALVCYAASPTGWLADLAYYGGVWAAGAYAWLAAGRAERRLVPVLIATGVTLSAVGDSVWELLDRLGVTPDASVADVFYLSSYVAVVAALVALLPGRGSRDGEGADAAIDALTVVVISIMVMWTVSINDLVADDSVSRMVRLVWAAYPVLDAVVIALALRVLVTRPRERGIATLTAGAVAWFVSDTGYLVFGLGDGMETLLDLGWMVGAFLLAAATRLEPATGRSGEGAATARRVHGRVGIAVLPLLVPAGLEILHDVRRGELVSYPALLGLAVLVGLAYARTARMLRSERALRDRVRASERRSSALAANSSDAIIVVAEDGRMLHDSSHLSRRLGRPSVDGTGELLSLVSPEDRLAIASALDRSVACPDEVVTVEFRAIGEHGHPRWLSARFANLLDHPDVEGVVVAVSDATTRKEMERELERSRDAALEASRAKSAFLANMSHEIRTPMNGVIGLTELLLTTPLEDRQQRYAEGIRTAGSALLTIIDDILDFSKVEAGKLVLETIDFDLARVVEDAGEVVAETASRKGLELLAYCSPEVPLALRGDPSRLRQVILNLVSNAVKFTETGEVVLSAHLVESTSQGHVVRFEVSDTGIGLDPDRAEQLFAPFSQADSSTTRRYGGTGLGLAISRQLVEAMGGTIGVESTLGVGSTFWFAIPLRPADDAQVTQPPRGADLEDVPVLVVDDNETNRLVLVDQLTAWGMRPYAVADAASGLRQLRAAAASGAPYRLALLDLCMPDVDGLELARRIHADRALIPLAMVLLTSGPELSFEEARSLGIAQSLRKPVRHSHLGVALREALAHSQNKPAPPPVPPRHGSPLGHVLVVEDNEINQLVACALLEQLHYTYEVAADGYEALEALDRSRFSAVLMDCQMPELDGYAATRALRARDHVGRAVPVIAMTAGVTEEERKRCLAAGMDDYISKPVDVAKLTATLSRWTSTSEEVSAPFGAPTSTSRR
jgi:two-component system, sensor histidine kinase and response regulator